MFRKFRGTKPVLLAAWCAEFREKLMLNMLFREDHFILPRLPPCRTVLLLLRHPVADDKSLLFFINEIVNKLRKM